MVLDKLPVPGRPTILITVGQGPTALAVGAGGGCLDIFTLICPFFLPSPSLWETARYRLKYCLKGPLNPKPTYQPNSIYLTTTPNIFLNQTYLVRLGIFHLELGKKHTFWLWEWGRISAPNFGDREPCQCRDTFESKY